jgi:hypothetical protein
MGFNAARGYPGQEDRRHGAARPVERKLGPKPGDGRRTLEDDVHFACRRVVDTPAAEGAGGT